MNASEDIETAEAIAIIGMSARVPGAGNVDEFWRNIENGVESVTYFSDQDLVAAGVDPRLISNPNYVKAGRPLKDCDLFDAAFFGFTPREAEAMDPQQRVFMETCVEALESAGYFTDRYSGRIGVFAGASTSLYVANVFTHPDLVNALGSTQIWLGNDKDHLATRCSYKLGLTGPSVGVQTACSTSLVAIHQACQSLYSYQSDIVLAGGVSIGATQGEGYVYQEDGIYSPDGHCRAFDAAANGTVSGSGIGVVALKRLSEAIADRDTIHAVIKGIAINNDGSNKVGYTAPSINGQTEVIAEALALANVPADTIGYVETHGTGTPLGDPIEIAALTQAYRTQTQRTGFCAIGAVKTNIGHLDAAAGVIGLIKASLTLKHKKIPASLNFQSPNPKLSLVSSPFYVSAKLRDWEPCDTPRRAGVSSFGMGGTNAHAILEEAPPITGTSAAGEGSWGETSSDSSESSRCAGSQLLVLSAKTAVSLDYAANRLADYLDGDNPVDLADVAYTLAVGRRTYAYRRSVAASDAAEAAELLRGSVGSVSDSVIDQASPYVVFMFPGQGSQYVDMARGLYDNQPIFRRCVDQCCEVLEPILGLDLRSVLFSDYTGNGFCAGNINETHLAQPALFTVEYALARVWSSWGIHPQAMIGHSIGEYVAACLAGVFSLEDALTLVAKRGQIMRKCPPGAMLAVMLGEQDLVRLLPNNLEIAAVNSPSVCTVSGPVAEIDNFQTYLEEKRIDCQRLVTSHAFHSRLIDPYIGEFTDAVRQVTLNEPKIPYLSNVTGDWISASQARDPAYWAAHLRKTVRFAAGIGTVLKDHQPLFLEVGPGGVLTKLASQTAGEARCISVRSCRAIKEQQPDHSVLLAAAGQLWRAGLKIDWEAMFAGKNCGRIPLPTYAFERSRFWISSNGSKVRGPEEGGRFATSTGGPADGPSADMGEKRDIEDWFYLPAWKQSVPGQLGKREEQPGRRDIRLVFANPGRLSSALLNRFEEGGRTVVSVSAGERFENLGSRRFVIDPECAEDYGTLVAALRQAGELPTRILHLWSVIDGVREGARSEPSADGTGPGFISLLFLAQALGNVSQAGEVEITVISNNMQDVAGEGALHPERATVLGPCKVIPQEYPHITCRSIDVTLPLPQEWQFDRLVGQLENELAITRADQIVAYRGPYRWVQTYTPVRLTESDRESSRLRHQGVYLLTGGFGGMALALAEFLAKQARAKLVLLGRTAFPERWEWNEWLIRHAADDKTSAKIRQLQSIEDCGAELLLLQADVTDREQMRDAVRQARVRFGSIHGVIHAAGVAGGGVIPLKSRVAAQSVMSPKVLGATILDEIFRNDPLDFVVYCSSLNAVAGGFGQVDYCGANAFLDALSHRAVFPNDRVTTSINWDAWGETGMAVNTEVPAYLHDAHQEALRAALSTAQGVMAFARILNGNLPQVLVSKAPLSRLIDKPPESHDVPAKRAAPATHARPSALRSAFVAPRTDLERSVAETWQIVLGIEQIGVHDNFYELGGDSLIGTQVISQLRQTLRIPIPLRIFLESPTVEVLVANIESILWTMRNPHGSVEDGETGEI